MTDTIIITFLAAVLASMVTYFIMKEKAKEQAKKNYDSAHIQSLDNQLKTQITRRVLLDVVSNVLEIVSKSDKASLRNKIEIDRAYAQSERNITNKSVKAELFAKILKMVDESLKK